VTNLFKTWMCIGIAAGIDPTAEYRWLIVYQTGFIIAALIYLWKARPWKERVEKGQTHD